MGHQSAVFVLFLIAERSFWLIEMMLQETGNRHGAPYQGSGSGARWEWLPQQLDDLGDEQVRSGGRVRMGAGSPRWHRAFLSGRDVCLKQTVRY